MTKPQLNAAVNATLAVAEAIRELKEIPSGHLYARLMSVMDQGQYEALIRILINTGLVEQTPAHLLRWVGPAV